MHTHTHTHTHTIHTHTHSYTHTRTHTRWGGRLCLFARSTLKLQLFLDFREIEKIAFQYVQTTPMGTITHTHSPWTGVESSKTYPRVRISVYSPRTTTRSKCLQNPWGVTLTMEPNHLRRLQDAVGFFFFTTTNQQIPTGTTCADAFMTQWIFSFLPRQTDAYPRVLHDAFAPVVYGLVYMTQWVFLFYHDKQTNTHGYHIHGFHFFPTTT